MFFRGHNFVHSQFSTIRTIFLRLAVAAAPLATVQDKNILPGFMLATTRIPVLSANCLRKPVFLESRVLPLHLAAPVRGSQPVKTVWFPSTEERKVRPAGHILHPLVVQLDKSIGLMEQQLARLGLRQEWLPTNSSFLFALGQQMMRMRLLPPSTELNDFVLSESKATALFLEEHATSLKAAGILPKSEVQGQMLASACRHSVTVVHWSAASEGLVETIYSPPQDFGSRCRIYVCSVGPILWSTVPLGAGDVKVRIDNADGLVSESRISDEISQRLLRAQSLSSAVRWISVHRVFHDPNVESVYSPGTGTIQRQGYISGSPGNLAVQNDQAADHSGSETHLNNALEAQPGQHVAHSSAPDDLTQPHEGSARDAVSSAVQGRGKAKGTKGVATTRKSNKRPPEDSEAGDGHEGGPGLNSSDAPAGDYWLIDVSGLIYRSYHALPAVARDDGVVNNAVFGFCRALQKVLLSVAPGATVIPVFDKGSHTFRNDLYPDYKAHRPPMPPDLAPQFDVIREATVAFGLTFVEVEGYEADDIIATYAKMAAERGGNVRIVSTDKDMCQLVGPRVKLWDHSKDQEIGPDEVLAKFGVGPERVVDVQALIGDASDNVPGVKGIGVKTAASLINQFGSFEALMQQHEAVNKPRFRQLLKDQLAMAQLSYELVRLRTDVQVPPLSNFRYGAPDRERLRTFYRSQGFKSLIAELDRAARTAASGIAPRAPIPRIKAAAAAADAMLDAAAKAAAGDHETAAEAVTRPTTNVEYSMVTTKEELAEWVEAAERVGRLSITALGTTMDAQSADLVGFALAVNPGKACYIPVADGEKAEDAGRWTVKEALESLRAMLQSPSIVKIGYDVKFLHSIVARHTPDLLINPVDDTMVLSFVLDAGKQRHSLAEITESELGVTPLTLKDVAVQTLNKTLRGQPSLVDLPPDVVRQFACQAADLALQVHERLSKRLVDERLSRVYHHMERPLVSVLARMEQRGVEVDTGKLTQLSSDFASKLVVLEKDIYELAGHDFSIASPKQLAQVLFEELKLPVTGVKKGKTGVLSTDGDVLDELASKGFAIAEKVNQWRQVAKLKSTFTDGLLAQINPRTGRLHTRFCMAAAATGRLSSVDPNLQNIPTVGLGKPIREAFTAAPGYTLMAADYSQIELRLLAHMARIDSLQDAFRNGVDVHSLTASQVFGVPLDKMTSDVRRKAKAINFGIIYGQSAFGLSKGLNISVADAKSYIEKYFEQYPGIQAYMTHTREAASRQGFVETLFGRRCHIVNMAKTGALRSYADRQAINAPIQGTAADIIKRAMVRIEPALHRAGLGARMVLQVHDELVFEVPHDQLEQTVKLVKSIMENAAEPTQSLSVPLIVDTGTGKSWAAAH